LEVSADNVHPKRLSAVHQRCDTSGVNRRTDELRSIECCQGIRAETVCQQTAGTGLNWSPQQRQPASKQQRVATGALQAKQQN